MATFLRTASTPHALTCCDDLILWYVWPKAEASSSYSKICSECQNFDRWLFTFPVKKSVGTVVIRTAHSLVYTRPFTQLGGCVQFAPNAAHHG